MTLARKALALAVLSAATLAACRPSPPPLSDEAAGALIASRVTVLRSAAAAAPQAAGEAADLAAAGPSPTPLPRPPRNDAERRGRAQGALPPGQSLGPLTVAGDGARFAVALSQATAVDGKSQSTLQLFDVSSPSGLLVGEHEFGASQGPANPVVIESGLELRAEGGEPVVLAVFSSTDKEVAAPVPCGWWLRRRGTTFVCAPMLSPASHFSVVDGGLAESWDADLPGNARRGSAHTTGRILRLVDGRWREVDHFRCLAQSPEVAGRQAGSNGIGLWQREMVQRLTAAARRANEALDLDAARSQLEEALRVDACDAEVYRLIGRLEFDSGRAGDAVPALAIAVALAPRDDGALLDLADATAVLNVRTTAGRAALGSAIATLDDRTPTRQMVDRARAAAHGAVAPRDLAIALYTAFLERTEGAATLQDSARRHASEKLAELQRAATPRRRQH